MNSTPVIRIIAQARMGSSRLPGKIAARLGSSTLLGQVVRGLRLAAAQFTPPGEVWVATTTNPGDDVTEQQCNQLGVRCFRGSPDDVLARYVNAAADLPDDATVVRATADNPLYCPRRAAALVAAHLAAGADYSSIEDLSYVVPEVMRAGALRQMAPLAGDDAYCHEHVTPYFRQTGKPFQVQALPATWQNLRPDIRLTVDTAAELARMQQLFAALEGEEWISLEAAYGWCDRHPIG